MGTRFILNLFLRLLGLPWWLRRLLLPVGGLYLLSTQRQALFQLFL